jgi:prevent-host-death family protein
MSAYSVADAKAGLPGLIDKAMAGEDVIITRRGKPVAELRPSPRAAVPPVDKAAFYDWLAARRSHPKTPSLTSVEVLNALYEDPPS